MKNNFLRYPIKEIFKIVGGNPAPKGNDAFSDVGIPFLKMKDLGKYHLTSNLIVIENRVSNSVAEKNGLKLIKKGSILLPRTGSVALNHRAVLGVDSFMVSHICALEVIDKNKVYNKYAYYYLCTINMDSITKKTTGLDAITFQDLGNITIPLPPLDDQIRIATILSLAERLISKRKESIRLLDELLKSTFLEMFGDTAIMQRQPKIKLGDFILFLTSGSRGWAQYYAESGDVFLRINNVRDASIKLDDLVYVNPPDTSEAIRTKVKTNDLLFSITADIGRTAVVPKKLNGAFINQHLALIRLKQEELNPIFVAWFYSMPFGKSIVMKRNREGVKAGLNFDDIRAFELIIPPLPLQNKFAAIVEKVEFIKSKYAQSLTELEKLYGSLSQRAFKSELDLSRVPVEAAIKPELFEQKMGIPKVVETAAKTFSEKELTKRLKEKKEKSFSFEALMEELVNASFEETPEYEQVKSMLFKMLEGKKPLLSQSFDEKKREIVLSVNR